MENEIWRDINGYEGNYKVSSLGRIMSCQKYVKGRWGKYVLKKSKIMRQVIGKNGYLHLNLYTGKKPHTFDVHRIVASAFLKKNNDFDDVNHKNGNKKDNRVDNLEFISRSENLIHRYRELKQSAVGSKKVICIETNKEYETETEAAKDIGVSKSSIGTAIKKNYRCKGLHFRFMRDL